MIGKCILIDNYDSFTYNIVQYLKELCIEPKVFKNDEVKVSELKKINFSSIIISPGPGNPDNSGISIEAIKEFYKTKKILGVCLGHQCIAQYFGCKIVKAKVPVHGKVSRIYFENDKLFEGIEQGFNATRYHSLIVDNKFLTGSIIPLAYAGEKEEKVKGKRKEFCVVGLESPTYCYDAKSKEQKVKSDTSPFTLNSPLLMALKHKEYPVYGVQFHPEAILTQYGKKLLENFFKI